MAAACSHCVWLFTPWNPVGCQVFKCSIIHLKESLYAVFHFNVESFQWIQPSSEPPQLTMNQRANKTITLKTLMLKRTRAQSVQKSFSSFWIHPTPGPGLSQLVSLRYKNHSAKRCNYFFVLAQKYFLLWPADWVSPLQWTSSLPQSTSVLRLNQYGWLL